MNIILKFVSKNILEKKFRTFLIVFTIMISSALFFASNSIADIFIKMVTDRFKIQAGTSDISVQANRESPTPYFYTNGAEALRDKFDYVVGVLNGSAFYKVSKDEIVNFSLQGIRLEDLQVWNPVTFSEQDKLSPFEGRKVVISKVTADKYGFKIGDPIQLEINSVKQMFTICALANSVSLFNDESRASFAIVPRETLAALSDRNGKVNTVYIKVKDKAQIPQLIEELSKSYNKYEVQEPFPKERIVSSLNQIKIPFQAMMIIVTFMSVFIIYSTFKVITAERLPIIGTLRSIGATKRIADVILLAESIFYGLVGGVTGYAAGLGVLYAMAFALTPKGMKGLSISVPISPLKLLYTIMFAVVLCLVSSILPILKVSRIPVKDIVLNAMEYVNPKKTRKLIIGIVLLLFGLILPHYTPKAFLMPIGLLCMLASSAGIVILVPFITSAFIKVFETVYLHVLGNEGVLAAKNLRENKSVLTSISLLIIGISSLLMINTISTSISTELMNVTTTYQKFEMQMSVRQSERNSDTSLLQLISRVKGVKEVYGSFDTSNVKYPAKNDKIGTIEGIDTAHYMDFWKIDVVGDSNSLMQKLETGRNILITTTLKDKFNLKVGDVMELTMPRGNKVYTVIGFYDTLNNGGDGALIAQKYFKTDTGEQYFADFFIKTSGDPDEVEKQIKNQFIRIHPRTMTKKYMQKMALQGLGQLFIVLTSFSALAMLIGIIGVFNNILIGFLSRRHSLAMFRSLGMSRKQMLKMFLIESFTGGLIGGVLGIVAGVAMIAVIPPMMKAAGIPLEVTFNNNVMAISLLSGVVITVAATIGPALNAAKSNIIEAIKFE